MKYSDFHGFKISSIGLGCSRLGSFTGSSTKEAESLLRFALDEGVTFFDTSSSYGQGDSERILGRIVGGNDRICVATKIGKVVPVKAKIFKPAKIVFRALTRRSNTTREIVKHSRPKLLPTNFDVPFLTRELEACQRRLAMEAIPMVMLHSVPTEILVRGEAITVLDKALDRGSLRMIGVSVDNLQAAQAALVDERIHAVQVPLHENDIAMRCWTQRAERSGKLVIAREIFGGPSQIVLSNDMVRRNVLRASADNSNGVSLVGTTKEQHLEEAIRIAEGAL